MKRNLLIGFMMMLVLAVFVGCSNDNSSESEKDDGEKTVITYWSNWNDGEPQQQVLEQIIKDYEKENPNVEFDVEWMGRQVLTKVKQSEMTDDSPDLIDKSADEIIGTLGNNLESLDGFLDKEVPNEDALIRDVMVEETLALHATEGKVQFIPYTVASSGIFYNKTMFEELGLTTPKTWDEFMTLGNDLKSQGVPPLGQDGTMGVFNAYFFYWGSHRINGAGAFNEAAGDKTGEKWNEPGFLEAAKKVEEIVENDFFIDGYQGNTFPAGQTQWAQGSAAMMLNGSWLANETVEYTSDDFEYGTFPFPDIVGDEDNYNEVENYLIGWSVPTGGNVEAVEDFLAFAMQKGYQESLVEKAQIINSRNDLSAPTNLVDMKEILDNKTGTHEIFDGVRKDYPNWWSSVFLPINDELLFGSLTAEEFIDELSKKSEEFWSAN